jgi:hypothetical protein
MVRSSQNSWGLKITCGDISYDFSGKALPCRHPLASEVLPLLKAAEAVKREQHRFLGFVRFQKTEEGLLFAEIEPQYDVLLLLVKHFRHRYPRSGGSSLSPDEAKGFYVKMGKYAKFRFLIFTRDIREMIFVTYGNSITIRSLLQSAKICV